MAAHGVLERGARTRRAMTAPAHQEGQAPSGHESSPNAIEWTPRLVAAFLADAAQRLRRLQNAEIEELYKACPEVLHQVLNIQATAGDAPCPSSRRAVAQTRAALRWLQWLDQDVRCLAWDRANGRPWKAVAHARGIDRSTAWRRWTCAMFTIAARLNAANDATPSQHREAIRPPDDPVD
jgi:hypothetical protein